MPGGRSVPSSDDAASHILGMLLPVSFKAATFSFRNETFIHSSLEATFMMTLVQSCLSNIDQVSEYEVSRKRYNSGI